MPLLACCLQSVVLQRKSCVSEHLLGAPLLSMQQESLMGISPHSLLPVRVWPSLVPRPRPAFHHLQYGKALPYCKRRKAGWGLGTFTVLQAMESWVGPGNVYRTASDGKLGGAWERLPYCKRRKAGWGLGTFTVLQATESWAGPGNVYHTASDGKLGGAWERLPYCKRRKAR